MRVHAKLWLFGYWYRYFPRQLPIQRLGPNYQCMSPLCLSATGRRWPPCIIATTAAEITMDPPVATNQVPTSGALNSSPRVLVVPTSTNSLTSVASALGTSSKSWRNPPSNCFYACFCRSTHAGCAVGFRIMETLMHIEWPTGMEHTSMALVDDLQKMMSL
jgi:hypothetical protein